ncbi:MAG: hypothetical protein DCC71_11805 [Proteobacteria bacterium]|nr:MAG: hypothetical protein DCC71_11805 [Pseudomonadota bacterium]
MGPVERDDSDRDDSDRERSYEATFARQHRQLDAMFDGLLLALRSDAGELHGVRERFAALRDALEAHVDQEDRLYYPAVRALRPVYRPQIEQLFDAHETFRARLGEIDASLANGAAADARAALGEFARAFALHEAAEEQMLRSIDAELAAAAAETPLP